MADSVAGYTIPPTRPWQGIIDQDGDGTYSVVQSGTGYAPPEAAAEEPAPAPPPDQPDQ